jgi:peptidoglycan/LPS O-acetylase OafA/YrhL
MPVLVFSLILMMLARELISADSGMFGKIVHVSLLPYLFFFLIGATLRIIHERNKVFRSSLTKFLALYFSLIILHEWLGLTGSTGNNLNPVQAVALGCLIVSAAFSKVGFSKNTLRGNDISYGLYIYHMPIVNYLLYKNIVGGQGLVICLVMTTLLAGLSWRLVEKPALGLKHYSIAN